ncbi:hypothetical protein F8M41_010197 [Gigaspora margarita]|uniref:Uncharacterized protein n=1 Tax=Gigaspora margarita TaxID=4874 RepID=A0A8H3X151_GIGMA|nr:hypothetical protein F8M41_010197 [Gigaspora margarita]
MSTNNNTTPTTNNTTLTTNDTTTTTTITTIYDTTTPTTNNPTASKPNPMDITLTKKHEEIRNDGSRSSDTVTLRTRSNDGSLDFNKLQKFLNKK